MRMINYWAVLIPAYIAAALLMAWTFAAIVGLGAACLLAL